MSTYVSMRVDFAERILELVAGQSRWSQATFGTDEDRGPIGALRHLQKEAKEAIENPSDVSEYADCLLLIIDASRRAGFDFPALLSAAEEKHKINQRREWPAPTDDETPVEHVREAEHFGTVFPGQSPTEAAAEIQAYDDTEATTD